MKNYKIHPSSSNNLKNKKSQLLLAYPLRLKLRTDLHLGGWGLGVNDHEN